jgi:hypothetical protein
MVGFISTMHLYSKKCHYALSSILTGLFREKKSREHEMKQMQRIRIVAGECETSKHLCSYIQRGAFTSPRPSTAPSYTEIWIARFHSRAGSRAAV